MLARSAFSASTAGLGGGSPARRNLFQLAIATPHIMSLADQAIVSGASFLMTVAVGRLGNPTELGLYSVGMSLLMTMVSVQIAFISLPYTIDSGRGGQNEVERLGGTLAQGFLLSGVFATMLALAAAVLSWTDLTEGAAIAWLALAVPFTLLREFARQHAFASLRLDRALGLDVAATVIQVAVLACLVWQSPMRATTAYIAIAAGCGIAGLTWLAFMRHAIAFTSDGLLSSSKRSWTIGRWLIATQITVSIQGYVSFWLLAWLLGAAVAGIYTACLTIVLFANPIVMGLGNVLAPRTVRTLTAEGAAGVRRQVIMDSLLIGAAVTGFYVVILLFADQLIALMFRSATYQGYIGTVLVLAAGLLISAIGMPASRALACLERPRPIFWAGLLGATVSVVASWPLAMQYGVLGAACGFAAGNLTGAAARWVVFLAVTRHLDRASAAQRDIVSVLRQSPLTVDIHDIQDIRMLGAGDEAFVYRVRLSSTTAPYAVKLFKSLPAASLDLIRADLLAEMYQLLDGYSTGAWTVSVPQPLFVSDVPPALVMTVVHGRPIHQCLETRGQLSLETWVTLPPAVVAAMRRVWSHGIAHGDRNLENILCDGPSRRLTFLDPGAPLAPCCPCGLANGRRPAACDLGHLLFEEATKIRRSIGRPGAMLRRQKFVRALLRAQLETIQSRADRRSFLAEVRYCGRSHLTLLLPSWTPRGMWLAVLRTMAARIIDRIIGRLMLETRQSPTAT
jgi:O-antigen/teichoic acid export membrane protein/tRNA A-37 threonylcarbamoyl transferase component Bud32